MKERKVSMTSAIVFLFVLLGGSVPAWAGTLTAELDRNQVEAGDAAQLSVTVSGSLKDDIALPPVAGLTFQQIGTSTNVQIVNGAFSKETTYNFAVTADRAGTFQIPSIKATIDKEDLATPPLTVTFGSGTGQAQPSAPGSNVPIPSPQNGATDQAKPGSGEPPFLFIEREWSNQNPYEGEAVVTTIRVFQRVRVMSMVPEREPSPAWRIIGKDKEGQKSYETERDGLRWRVTELTEVLVPLKSGSLPSPSFSLQATYLQPSKQRIRRGSIWDLFQGGLMDSGQEIAKKISSPAKTITVKPLPTDGRPSISSDMVGDFKLTTDVSRRTLNSGETATVSVRVSGRGALDRMADIKLPTLVGARIYPDKPQLKETVDDTGLRSSKEYKFAIVPSQPGDQHLGAVELGVFDPDTRKWLTLKEDLGVITVAGVGTPSSATGPAEQAPQNSQATAAAPSPAPTNHNQMQDPNSKDPIQLQPADAPGSMNQSVLTTWFGIAVFLLGLVGCILFAKPLMRRYKEWKSRRTSTKQPYVGLKPLLARYGTAPATGVPELMLELQNLTATDGQDPRSMTAKDIVTALRGAHVPESNVAKLEDILKSMESSAYRGSNTPLDDALVREFFDSLAPIAAWEK